MVIGIGTEFHGVKDMLIDGMIVPVLHPATKRPAKAGGQNIHPGFNEPSGQQQLLAPSISAITITDPWVFQIQIKGYFCLRVGQQRHCLGFKFIKGGKLPSLIKAPFKRVQFLAKVGAASNAANLVLVRKTNIGHRETGGIRIARNDKR